MTLQVPREEAQEYAQKHDMIFMEISAKTGDNVGTLFEEIGMFAMLRASVKSRNHVLVCSAGSQESRR